MAARLTQLIQSAFDRWPLARRLKPLTHRLSNTWVNASVSRWLCVDFSSQFAAELFADIASEASEHLFLCVASKPIKTWQMV